MTYRLARVQNKLNAQAASLLRANCDLSLTEWRVISLASLLGETTATTMAREVDMDKGQISRAIKRLLEAEHLISKHSQSDGRQSLLSLSESGKTLHARVIPVMMERQHGLVEGIDEADLLTFYKVLEILEDKVRPDENL
jgi:DNA-binding MarR family transcriptional regulator